MRMKIYNKGQVVIPAELRKKYNIVVGDYVEVVLDENCIKLMPVRNVDVVDALFGSLRNTNCKDAINDPAADKIMEDELIRGWKANESD